jgi:hypothetical protein
MPLAYKTLAGNPFVVGDPVQATHAPHLLGKVVRVTEAACDWAGTPMQLALVFVKLIVGDAVIAYYPEELRVCKCVARIPKGVSKCQE